MDEADILRMHGRALDLTGEGDRISKVRTPRTSEAEKSQAKVQFRRGNLVNLQYQADCG